MRGGTTARVCACERLTELIDLSAEIGGALECLLALRNDQLAFGHAFVVLDRFEERCDGRIDLSAPCRCMRRIDAVRVDIGADRSCLARGQIVQRVHRGGGSQARCGVCAAHVTPLLSSRTPETMSAKEVAPTAEDMTSKD